MKATHWVLRHVLGENEAKAKGHVAAFETADEALTTLRLMPLPGPVAYTITDDPSSLLEYCKTYKLNAEDYYESDF